MYVLIFVIVGKVFSRVIIEVNLYIIGLNGVFFLNYNWYLEIIVLRGSLKFFCVSNNLCRFLFSLRSFFIFFFVEK